MNSHKLLNLMVMASLLLLSLLANFIGLAEAASASAEGSIHDLNAVKTGTVLVNSSPVQTTLTTKLGSALPSVIPPKRPQLQGTSILTLTKTADPTSIPEPGGNVSYTVIITNTSAVTSVTLYTLTDSIHGYLNGQGSCTLPQAMAAGGGPYQCLFTANVSGNAGYNETNLLTAEGTDDGGQKVSASNQASVTITDIEPDIVVTKTANPTSVPETGDNVTFTIQVTNNNAEQTTLDSLDDDIFGDLDGEGDCSVPQTLAANGGTYSCSFTEFISGNFGGPVHQNTVTAVASDDDGNSDSETSTETVAFTDVPSSIEVTKTANPTSVNEPGDDVDYTVVVTNTSIADVVTITTVIDDQFGDVSANCSPGLPAKLATGASITCTFTEFVAGQPGTPHTNEVTASGIDDDGLPVSDSDTAQVTFNNLKPTIIWVKKSANPTTVPESGGTVTFTVQIVNFNINMSADSVTITDLVDDIHGDLDGQGDCSVPWTIPPNGIDECTFSTLVSGDFPSPETDTVTASGLDDDNDPVSDSDDAKVDFTDVLPDISVTKTANPTSVPETGDNVTFTIQVTNNSTEQATLDSLSDDLFGNLHGKGNCVANGTATIPPNGGTYNCSFTEFISGDFGGPAHQNTVTAVASDDDGNSDTDNDQATVSFTDAQPDITVTKTANLPGVVEPGDNVTFTIQVTNNSAEQATLDSLNDDVFGDLNGQGDCSVPQTLAGGGTYSCSFTEFISGNFGDPAHQNTVTVVVSDDEGNSVPGNDQATVTFHSKYRLYLPILIKNNQLTELYVHNDHTGDDVTVIVSDLTNVEITRCTVSDGDTIPCDHDGDGSNIFPAGTYNVEAISACGTGTVQKTYEPGRQTTRIFCQ